MSPAVMCNITCYIIFPQCTVCSIVLLDDLGPQNNSDNQQHQKCRTHTNNTMDLIQFCSVSSFTPSNHFYPINMAHCVVVVVLAVFAVPKKRRERIAASTVRWNVFWFTWIFCLFVSFVKPMHVQAIECIEQVCVEGKPSQPNLLLVCLLSVLSLSLSSYARSLHKAIDTHKHKVLYRFIFIDLLQLHSPPPPNKKRGKESWLGGACL